MIELLVVEDDDAFFARLQDKVGAAVEGRVALRRVADGEAARRACGEVPPDLVLCDLGLPPEPGEPPEDREGERFVRWLREQGPGPRVVLLSGQDLSRALHLVQEGAVQDFLSKAATWDEIRGRVVCALEETARAQAAAARGGDGSSGEEADLVGGTEGMRVARETLARAAEVDTTVLLLGETGTGKSRAARWLHAHSARRDGPFVAVACGALPGELIEAELFGHAAGAFTGATAARKGRFRSADGGTLLLDELGEVPLSTQAKLLRVLEEREVEPLGTDRAVPVDVRLVAATHRDLASMVAEGSFREDLFYRLRVLTVTLPPLRERAEDLEALVEHFLAEVRPRRSGLTDDAWEFLRRLPFPGNVRELRHLLEAAAVHAPGERIHAVDLGRGMGPWSGSGRGGAGPDLAALLEDPDFSMKDWLVEQEEALTDLALERAGGNAADAARMLGEKPDTLRARLRRRKG